MTRNESSARQRPGQRENPHRLYRDRANGMLAGVCAGLADYLGMEVTVLRLVVGVSALFFMPFVVVAYIVLTIVLPVRPELPVEDPERAEFWRDLNNAPADVFGNVRHRFRELDRRVQRMEAYVTSREFSIDRELGGKPAKGAGNQ
jgi:phage shock protein C